jgi:Ca-activated chloride channel homolog
MLRKALFLATLIVGGCASGISGGGQATEPGGAAPAVPAPAALEPAAWGKTGQATPLNAALIYTDPGELPRLELAKDSAKKLSLEHTHVSAKLHGFVAEVEVAQTYSNPFPEPIEAVYVFPLPENSAVNHLHMLIGERRIEAEVKERRVARTMYEEAKRSGHTAALLEQERPNVFTQSVANIEPGKKIDVVVRYLQDLTYDRGQYEFVFPMVVGPRYMPGATIDGAPKGKGTKHDTNRVPDASRISPPYVGAGTRSGRDISLELVASADLPLGAFEVPTHEVVSRTPADGTLRLTLAEKASIPNRDFVLRYQAAAREPGARLALSEAKDGKGFFSLVVQPPALDVNALVGQREIIFVVDVSGSMSGVPLSMCRAAMREALGALRPVDTFNVFTFSGATSRAFERSVPANEANVRRAFEVVSELDAGGGTEMADAVREALSPDLADGRHRYVFFMTDGFVGNEDEIIDGAGSFVREIEKQGKKARVFAFGVGSSVNRYLIDGLSSAGKGLAVYATPNEHPARAVNGFFHYIDRAVLEDLKIDWGGLQTEELLPQPLPDVFASHPLVVHGRYRGKPARPIVISARAGSQRYELPVRVDQAKSELYAARVLGALWAREKVGLLEQGIWDGREETVAPEITKLGLDFHLVTRYTSLIAIDSSRRLAAPAQRTVVEALDRPAGVDVAMAGGESYGYSFEGDRDSDGIADSQDVATDEDAAEEADMAPPPAPEPLEELEIYGVEQRRGCGCRVGARDSSRDALGLLVLGLFAVLRRTRKSPGGRGLS